jgi:hypothetical protein
MKPLNVDDIVEAVEADLTANYTAYKTEDTSSRDIKQGRYTRNVTWNYGGC